MWSLTAFLSAFHLSQAGVPAASITSAKMADDYLPSILKVFFDPSSRGFSTPNDGEGVRETYQTPLANSISKLDRQVSSLAFGILLTSIAIVGFAY